MKKKLRLRPFLFLPYRPGSLPVCLFAATFFILALAVLFLPLLPTALFLFHPPLGVGDEAGEHLGHQLEVVAESKVLRIIDGLPAVEDSEDGDALME